MQTIVVVLIVLAAVAYLTRSLWQKKPPQDKCGGGCSGCSCGH
ncbi:FeoB-associated Cys-rich membrane protein [Holophaga foetida]|nr:FeoB-associated Cys-rich membrane protein [Holophaga foetida]